VFVEPAAIKAICQYLFRDLDARYIISIGADDRPYTGSFLVATILRSTASICWPAS